MKTRFFLSIAILIIPFFTCHITAQEESENSSKFSPGVDFYSSYIWRGSKQGTGPAVQPYLEFNTGGLTLGAWGSFDADGFSETDLYATYSFPFGLSIGVTDYYLPDLKYFDYSDTSGSHAFELSAGFELGGLTLSGNIVLNEAGSVGSEGGDLYFEAGYTFKYFGIFLGAGDGWNTSDGDFAICNLGIQAEKEIKITDRFSIPVIGQVIFNPEKESLFVVVGFSL